MSLSLPELPGFDELQNRGLDPRAELQQLQELKRARTKKVDESKSFMQHVQGLGIGAGLLSGLAEQLNALGLLPDNLLEDLQSMVEDGLDTLNTMTLVLNTLKHADMVFWLTIVQVLVNEADDALRVQYTTIDQIKNRISAAVARIQQLQDLLGAGETQTVLELVYRNSERAHTQLLSAIDYVETGRYGIYRFTNAAIRALSEAEEAMERDIRRLSGFPGVQAAAQILGEVMTAVVDILALQAQYLLSYTLFLNLVDGIYWVRTHLSKTAEAFNRATIEQQLQERASSLESNVIVPLGKTLKRAEGLAQLAPKELQMYAQVGRERRVLQMMFGRRFQTLDQMSEDNQDYTRLVAALKAQTYPNIEPDKALSRIAEAVMRATIPMEKAGKASGDQVAAAARRSFGLLNGIQQEIEQVRRDLGQYGPYESAIATHLSGLLQGLGFTNQPLVQLGLGNIADALTVTAGGPAVASYKTATYTTGTAIVLFNEAINQSINEAHAGTERNQRKQELKREQRSWKRTQDKVLKERQQKIDALQETIDNMDTVLADGVPPWAGNPLELQGA